ncbi:hypothetical protein [Aestuariivivens insulae]|uniref:hypothetical protein n=1 Tax=Aestuariivivens insulae TaxID=1621988 RepID=UPI001F5AC8C4|nr:hypothetical protein [Aestuariivivens insulae]
MKTTFLKTSMLLLFLITACSSNESTNDNQEEPPKQNGKYIKKILKKDPSSYDDGSQFIYENDRLTYVYLDNCSGTLYHFEYNSAGKVSKRYDGFTSFEGGTFDPNTFDLDAFKAKNDTYVLNFVYENKKLVKMQADGTFINYQFIYNSDGTLHTAEWFLREIGLWEKVTLTYSGGNISNLNKKEYDTSGELNDNYDYTFEYDNNPNPFFQLNQGFGILGIYTCTGFDYISSEDMGLKLFRNNVTKVYKNGELLYDATYQYDKEGYPARISYTDFNGNISSVDIITY